ncbi:MAG: Flp family type IVb pilin [Pseudomonadota bacterium]
MDTKKLRAVFLQDDGATAVEYALLLGLLGLAMAPALLGLGNGMNGTFNEASDKL